MKRNLIYVFAAALAALFTLQSCGLEEPFPGPQDCISEGSVEFVVRPVSFNDHDVATKVDGDPATFEDDEIHNAFLLVFDAYGQRLLCEEISLNTEAGGLTAEYDQLSAKIDRALGTVTVCVLANVPKSFAEGIIGTTNPGGASANLYLDTAVLDLTYDSSVSDILGVPVLDLDNDSSTPAVACIPMFGQTQKPITLNTADSVIEIALERLFAKVSVELKLDHSTNLSTAQASTNFELNSYRLVNLPLKVSLLPQDAESAWVNDGGSFAGENSHVASEIKHKIYDADYILASDAQKKYTFDVYVPEYRLEPLPSTTDNYGQQEYKPKMYDSSKKAVHIVLRGSYIPGSGSSTVLDYSVFLGEDASTSFTLNRNVQYNNYLTITGITKKADNTDAALIDHRVTMSDGNMVSMFGEVANCYVISATGTYSFPAYKGAYKADDMQTAPKCTKGTKVEIIAQNGATNLFATDASGNPIFSLTTNPAGEKVISFDVVDSWDDANVILALKDDDGNIEWSWHLWFVHGPSLGNTDLAGFFEMKSQAMPNGKDELMDRNLGALYSLSQDGYSGAAKGFYYQYGRIAPYFEDTVIEPGRTTYHGYKLPEGLSWNPESDKKSYNDPCPPGYRVPDSEVFVETSSLGDASVSILGSDIVEAFRYWDCNTSSATDDIYFPYCTYVDTDGKLIESYIIESEPIPGNYPDIITGSLVRAYDINYSYTFSFKSGKFIACDDKILLYQAKASEGLLPDIEIISCKYQIGTTVFGQEIWGRERTYTAGSGAASNITDFLLTTVKSKLEQIPDLAQHTKPTIKGDTIDKSYGYQVRCVKE